MATNLRSAWPQVVGQAWADEEFRRRLLENPQRVLDELGVEIPAGHRVELLEDSQTQTFLVLPQKPANLDVVAAAHGRSLSTAIKADACTADPAFACTAEPSGACTHDPSGACTHDPAFACTHSPAGACTHNPAKPDGAPKPFACTSGPPVDACTPQPFACTSAPKKD
jgi:hypothetical protein